MFSTPDGDQSGSVAPTVVVGALCGVGVGLLAIIVFLLSSALEVPGGPPVITANEPRTGSGVVLDGPTPRPDDEARQGTGLPDLVADRPAVAGPPSPPSPDDDVPEIVRPDGSGDEEEPDLVEEPDVDPSRGLSARGGNEHGNGNGPKYGHAPGGRSEGEGPKGHGKPHGGKSHKGHGRHGGGAITARKGTPDTRT